LPFSVPKPDTRERASSSFELSTFESAILTNSLKSGNPHNMQDRLKADSIIINKKGDCLAWCFRLYEIKRLECPRCHGVFNHYQGVSPSGRKSEFVIRIKPEALVLGEAHGI